MRMTDDEIQHVFDKFNYLNMREDYWISAGMALVEYLHKEHGMRYADIYAIAEREPFTKKLRRDYEASSGNVIQLSAKEEEAY